MLRRSASAESNASGGSSSRRRGALARALRWTGLAAARGGWRGGGRRSAVIWLQLGPLPLSRAESMSVTVLDRNDRLLRAYTAADGRWRLPVDVKDVDARYLAMLIAFEDKRFRSHRGVDPWARGAGGLAAGGAPAHRLGRLDADHAGGAPAAGRARAHGRRQDPPGAARAGARTAHVQGCHPAPLPAAGAVRRQSGRRARGLAGLFRQGAEAAVAGGSGAAGGAAAVAGDAPARPLSARRRSARATACSIARWRPA